MAESYVRYSEGEHSRLDKEIHKHALLLASFADRVL